MTRHTQAIVLRQSVVSSIGKVLFCNIHYIGKAIPMNVPRGPFFFKYTIFLKINLSTQFKPLLEQFYILASDTNLVVALLKVFSMGVASA